jgi:Ca-activated chloride channel homolog
MIVIGGDMKILGFKVMKPLASRIVWVAMCLFTLTMTLFAQSDTNRSIPRRDPIDVSSNDQIIINSDLITLKITVMDTQGNLVQGLDKSSFVVFDDKIKQQISFFSDEDAPTSIGILLDVSGSMSNEKIMRAKEALASFIETSHPQDEFFLISFNDKPQLLLDRSRDVDVVRDKFKYVEPHGNTAVYDATYLGIQKLMQGTHNKRALLIISDGEDNSSRFTLNEVRRLAKESDVTIYAIGINLNPTGIRADNYGRSVLKDLASITGGKAFFPQSKTKMIEDLERISVELRRQYSIGYTPLNFNMDGKWHQVKVKVNPLENMPRLIVRSRQGYYAVGRPTINVSQKEVNTIKASIGDKKQQ